MACRYAHDQLHRKACAFSEAFIRGHSGKRGMGSLVVVEVLPFLDFFIKQLRIVYNNPLEHPIKLFLVASVAPFHLPVKLRSSGFYIYVIDPLVQHMPVELSLEFGAIIGLNQLRPKR